MRRKLIQWMAAGTLVLAAFFVFSSMRRMEPEFMTYDEIWRIAEQSEEIPEEEFDKLFDVVVDYLKTKGSFSDGGLEDADFSGSRYIDPVATLTLVSNVPITQSIAEGLRDALESLPRPHAVIFDGIDGASCVTSAGRYIRERPEDQL